MPNIHLALPETQQSIFRPIVIDVVKQVQAITKMKDTKIYFPEDGKVSAASGTIDSKDDRYVVTTSKRMNQIEVEEVVDDGEISPTFFDAREYRPILKDPKLGLTVSPVYAKHNVSVRFNYSSGSKTEALRWLQDMRMKLSRMRDINVHTVQYHYNLNKTVFEIVKKVHELREEQAGYGESFEEYLRQFATPRLTAVGDLIGNHRIFAISETQTEIYGIFEFDALPSKPEKDADSGMWMIAFEYKFNYDKPIGCHIRYPVLVHNLPMPYDWIGFTSDETRAVAKTVTDGSRAQAAFNQFRSDRVMDKIKAQDGMILIPRFDDFKPNTLLQFTAGAVQALAAITPDNRRDLIDLTDLDDIVLDPDILTFFRELEYPYLSQPYKSFFNLSLYQNEFLQDYRMLSVNNQLVVRATEDLDVRKQYRIRLSMVTDIDFVAPAAFARIRQHPKVMYLLVSAINRAFRENPEMANLCYNERLQIQEFDALYRHLLGKENMGNIPTIGWSLDNYLLLNGINPAVIRKIKMESRAALRTMITGILAHKKADDGKLQDQAGSLELPVQE